MSSYQPLPGAGARSSYINKLATNRFRSSHVDELATNRFRGGTWSKEHTSISSQQEKKNAPSGDL